MPKLHHSLTALKQVISTGSPLKPELFSWVYENIKSDLLLASITGGKLTIAICQSRGIFIDSVFSLSLSLLYCLGTDICSLFGAHNASLPVYEGEIQCIGLGMSIQSWSEEGVPVKTGEAGDLICTKPFVCMPVYFWNDTTGERYKSSYFEKFEGVWSHGDFCKHFILLAANRTKADLWI